MYPIISVIVPVYNGQEYLANCIKSIEAQDYPALEIIIINDGSTDETGKVCDSLTEQFKNIQVITMQDEGVSAARNAGMERASGEYLMFVDADDVLHPKAISLLYDTLVKTGSDISGCGFFVWSDRKEQEKGLKQEIEEAEDTRIYSREEFLKEGILGGDTRCWGKLYKKALVSGCTFQRGLTIGEDMLFLLDTLSSAEKLALVSFPGYGYFQNPKGAMKRKFSPGYMDQITCWELAREKVLKLDESLRAQVTAILQVSIMLTVGKLALLPAKERRKNREYIGLCREKLKKEQNTKGAFERLSKGYQIKTKLYAAFPELYLFLYHFWKALGGRG